MTDLSLLVASLGATPTSPLSQQPVVTPAQWLAAAQGRAAWQLWGKARPSDTCPAHPLLCHVVDVAAVAARLLTVVAPQALRTRLLQTPGLPEADSLRFLLFLVALHDIGKATPALQAKVDWARESLPGLGFDLAAPRDARHHGDIGFGFLADALKQLGADRRAARSFARTVTAHHGEFPSDMSFAKPPGAKERGAKPAWTHARTEIVAELQSLFGVERLPHDAPSHSDVVLVAGLTAVADWIGSMEEVFVYEPPQASLAEYWPRALDRAAQALERAGMRAQSPTTSKTFVELFPTYVPWPLHIAADEVSAALHEPCLVVVEAPMGEGKTEASLLLAEAAAARLGQQGLYIGLPTQATANQMLGRVQTFLGRVHAGEASNLILAHGEASLNERFQKLSQVYDRDGSAGGVHAEGWFLSKKRTLLADHAVGTIDQALLGVMLTSHGFVRLFGLAGKTVILDEVHAYDTFTSTILDRLVEWLAAMGSTVLLLSATLPSSRRAALVRAYRRGAGATDDRHAPTVVYPRITIASRGDASAAHFSSRGASTRIAVRRQVDDIGAIVDQLIAAVADGGCIGWICNTVARAQLAYSAVRQRAPELRHLLIHSRLLPEDRAAAETRLEEWLGPQDRGAERPRACIVVGTQVLEQSLDVDFDLLVTDLAPVDLLLQRAGRLHRHTRTNRAPNHAAPVLVLVAPEGGAVDAAIDDVAFVYAEALVRETLRVLEGRDAILLPDDIEPLVEAVYRDNLPLADDDLHDVKVAHRGERLAERQNAEARLIPRPTVEDDPFGAMKVRFTDDEDPQLHEQLRALTRLGERSVDIVCVVRRDGAIYTSDDSVAALDLQSKPDRAQVHALVRRSIGVSNQRLVSSLLADASYEPPGWRDSALLRYRRAVVFESGVAMVGDLTLTLDRELGLCVERTQKSKTAKGTA